jgi:hypothetical protein
MPISPKARRAGLELDTIAISLCLSRPWSPKRYFLDGIFGVSLCAGLCGELA